MGATCSGPRAMGPSAGEGADGVPAGGVTEADAAERGGEAEGAAERDEGAEGETKMARLKRRQSESKLKAEAAESESGGLFGGLLAAVGLQEEEEAGTGAAEDDFAEELTAEQLEAAALRLPVIGVLQGRLTRERLMELWNKHDPEEKGELPTEDTVPLVEDIIMLVPVLLREAAFAAVKPMEELAEAASSDSAYAESHARTAAEFKRDIEPLLKGLEIRLRSLKGHRMRKLVDRLIDRLDLNHDGTVDIYEYLATFLSHEIDDTAGVRRGDDGTLRRELDELRDLHRQIEEERAETDRMAAEVEAANARVREAAEKESARRKAGLGPTKAATAASEGELDLGGMGMDESG